jgi:hypothetical protein
MPSDDVKTPPDVKAPVSATDVPAELTLEANPVELAATGAKSKVTVLMYYPE